MATFGSRRLVTSRGVSALVAVIVPAMLATMLAGLVAVVPAQPAGAVAAEPSAGTDDGDDAAPGAIPADWSVEPAERALRRLLRDGRVNRVRFEAEQLAEPGADHYRISASRGKIVIGGTSPAVLLRGFNTYLGEVADKNISWNGQQTKTRGRVPLPDEEIFRRANVSHRFALNDTDDGYTGAYRTWEDWEHTIDVLALHGINEVFVPVGAGAVYLDTFREFGYTEAEMLQWIPQPAHQPWWLLQNMCCFPSAMSAELVEKRADLGARIADRLRELGMTPVLPGYFGTVPPGFAEKNPGAHVVPQGGWVGFDRPGWLDPTGATFDAVAEAFYRNSAQRFGVSSMYKMDLLHEGGRAGDVDVAEASRAVESALQRARPGAIWAILGWQNNPRPQTLAAIDRSKMLIVDGLADRYQGLDREEDWQGTPYAFGSIWNFGGHTTMGANMGVWNQRYWAWKNNDDSALDGIAVLPEASDNNPVGFDFLTSLAWSDGPQDMDAWYDDWATRRYGGADPAARRGWQALGDTAYAMGADGWSEAHDGLFGAQPSLTADSAASWSPKRMRYDAAAFAQALPALLEVSPRLRRSSAYRYDLADVARQVLSNRSRILLPQIRAAYDTGDITQFEQLTGQWFAAMDLLQQVTATNTQTMLGPWLADARSWASSPAEADRLEYDARSLLTVWGNRSGAEAGLHDYANREWAGLISTYYEPRWHAYFDELHASMTQHREPEPIDWYAFGDAWAHRTNPLPTSPTGDIHDIATDVLAHLRAHPSPLDLSADSNGAVTAEQPAVVQVRLDNPNPFTDATDATVRLGAAPGLQVRPLGETRQPVLPAGGQLTARFEVSITDSDAIDSVVTDLQAHASYRIGDRGRHLTSTVRLMTANGVDEPNQTVTFNDALFAQRGDTYAIEGGGADLWGGTNEFGAIYREDALASGTAASTRVVAQDDTGPWARAGLIVRNDMPTQGSTGFLNLALTPANGCVLSWDSNTDGRLDSFSRDQSFEGSAHLRLTRDGNRYVAECSADGDTWTQIGSVEVPAADTPDVGLFMTAAGSGRGLAQFAGFDITEAPAPEAPAPGTHYLSDLPFASAVGGHGPWERDTHNGETAAGDGGPITLAGTTYGKGLGTNADAEAVFYLGRACTRFTALVGIDDTMDKPDADGDVVFKVWADNRLVYQSGVVRAGEQPRTIDVDITGADELRLIVDKYDNNNWWDRADWADARLICG